MLVCAVKRCHEVVYGMGAPRINDHQAEYPHGPVEAMEDRVRSVREKP